MFTAISHPIRRKILDFLIDGEKTVSVLSKSINIPTRMISQHLVILQEVGLVEREKHGQREFYYLRPQALKEIYGWLLHYQRFWVDKLDKIGDYINQQESKF